MQKWMVIGPDGCDMFDTLTEARAAAEETLEPNGQWPDGIDQTCYGAFVPFGWAREVNRRPDPSGAFDYLCEYELVDRREFDTLRDRILDLEAEVGRLRRGLTDIKAVGPTAEGM